MHKETAAPAQTVEVTTIGNLVCPEFTALLVSHVITFEISFMRHFSLFHKLMGNSYMFNRDRVKEAKRFVPSELNNLAKVFKKMKETLIDMEKLMTASEEIFKKINTIIFGFAERITKVCSVFVSHHFRFFFIEQALYQFHERYQKICELFVSRFKLLGS